MTNEYSGSVNVKGMIKFLDTLEDEVEIWQTGDFTLGGTYSPDTAIEYLEGVVESEANSSATPWDDFDGNGLLDPESLEPWENGESYSGRFQLKSPEVNEDDINYRFDFKAIDGDGEDYNISFTGSEESYEGAASDLVGHASMSKAFDEAGL